MRDVVHSSPDTQAILDRVDLDPGHTRSDAQADLAGVDLGTVHARTVAQGGHDGASFCGDQYASEAHIARVAAPHDALVMILADALDDLERVRIATDNRIRSLGQVKGLDDSPETKRLGAIRDGIAALEHSATLDLQRAMRTHPLGAWVKRTVGVGEKQAARLLAAIGDPADRLNPAKLWQYAGHGDSARSKQTKDNVTYAVTEDGKKVAMLPFSPTAKMRTRMVADKAVQAGVRKIDGWDDTDGYDLVHRKAISPLGAVYLRERLRWADRDTTDMHKHNHALRVVGKAMLLDLWREARNLRGDHDTHDSHVQRVPADLRGDQEHHDIQVSCVPADLPPTTARSTTIEAPSAASLAGATS